MYLLTLKISTQITKVELHNAKDGKRRNKQRRKPKDNVRFATEILSTYKFELKFEKTNNF